MPFRLSGEPSMNPVRCTCPLPEKGQEMTRPTLGQKQVGFFHTMTHGMKHMSLFIFNTNLCAIHHMPSKSTAACKCNRIKILRILLTQVVNLRLCLPFAENKPVRLQHAVICAFKHSVSLSCSVVLSGTTNLTVLSFEWCKAAGITIFCCFSLHVPQSDLSNRTICPKPLKPKPYQLIWW